MWQHARFDRFQFDGRRIRAVSTSTHISFSDYGRMHVYRHNVQQDRRLETPAWANNDVELREAVLKFCEKRLYLVHKSEIPELTHQERLVRIRETEQIHLNRWRKILGKLRQRYKTEPETTKPSLDTEIQNADTQCCLLKRGNVAVVLAVIHFYYRLGWNSVAVAQELRLKPPHVRQILARLLHFATYGASQMRGASPPLSGPDLDLMMKWHRDGMPLNELTTRLRLLGYDPLKMSTVHRVLEQTKEAHFQKLQEQVAQAESIFARIPRT
jgi:hypothetical protein